jgi:hypothetical protein
MLASALLTWRESGCDLEICPAAFGSKLDHAGIRQPTARSTVTDANENCDGLSAPQRGVLSRKTSMFTRFLNRTVVTAHMYSGCSNYITPCRRLREGKPGITLFYERNIGADRDDMFGAKRVPCRPILECMPREHPVGLPAARDLFKKNQVAKTNNKRRQIK